MTYKIYVRNLSWEIFYSKFCNRPTHKKGIFMKFYILEFYENLSRKYEFY
jgi:hypothetical protein